MPEKGVSSPQRQGRVEDFPFPRFCIPESWRLCPFPNVTGSLSWPHSASLPSAPLSLSLATRFCLSPTTLIVTLLQEALAAPTAAIAALIDRTAAADGGETGDQAVLVAATLALLLGRRLLLVLHGLLGVLVVVARVGAALGRAVRVLFVALGRRWRAVALGRTVGWLRVLRVAAATTTTLVVVLRRHGVCAIVEQGSSDVYILGHGRSSARCRKRRVARRRRGGS